MILFIAARLALSSSAAVLFFTLVLRSFCASVSSSLAAVIPFSLAVFTNLSTYVFFAVAATLSAVADLILLRYVLTLLLNELTSLSYFDLA